MTNRRTFNITATPIDSALRPFASSIDPNTYKPLTSFPSGAEIAAWEAAGPPKSSI